MVGTKCFAGSPRVILSFFVVAAVCGTPGAARAFRCTQAVSASGLADGPALVWPARSLIFTLQADGTAQLPTAATFDVLRAAFAVWQNLTLSSDAQALCGDVSVATDLSFFETLPTGASWVGYDYLDPAINTNLLVFRDTVWKADPTNGDIIALTTTTYSALTGVILDADIEFNSAHFQFAATNPNANQMDLLSTAVHEIGHFLGLAHCTVDPTQTCGHGEVMEPVSNYGSISKRQLQCDDRAAVVFKYPANLPNAYCSLSTPAGCASGCIPPQLPTEVPQITQKDSNMGRGCQATPLDQTCLWLLLTGAIWQRRGHLRKTLVAVAWLSINCACQQTECGGQSVTFQPAAPLILNMAVVQQVADDPWLVVLNCDFVDPDGDLGDGQGQYFINGSPTGQPPFALSNAFATAGGLPHTATAGRIGLPIRFAFDTKPNATLHLRTQLKDAAGHLSNCYGLDLTFDLQPRDADVALSNPDP